MTRIAPTVERPKKKNASPSLSGKQSFPAVPTRNPPVLSCVWSRLYCQAYRLADWGGRAWKRRPIWLHQASLKKATRQWHESRRCETRTRKSWPN